MIIVTLLFGMFAALLLDRLVGKIHCKKYHDMTRGRYDA